jgi:hypothetical protein
MLCAARSAPFKGWDTGESARSHNSAMAAANADLWFRASARKPPERYRKGRWNGG